MELKTLYIRFMSNKLSENEKSFDLKNKFMEYIKLLIQQNRLFLGEQICSKFLNENMKLKVLGYNIPEFIIIYEDILRQQMNNMNKNILQNICDKMDKKRNKNGPKFILNNIINQNDQNEQKNDIKVCKYF